MAAPVVAVAAKAAAKAAATSAADKAASGGGKKPPGGGILTIVLIIVVFVAIILPATAVGLLVVAFVMVSGAGDSDPQHPSGPGDPGSTISGSITACTVVRKASEVDGKTTNGPWVGESLEMAEIMVGVAREREVSFHAAHIMIMTAMQESGMRNLPYDDDAMNPDGSIADGGGLFQQQPSQGWGTWEQIMDPQYATNTFLDALFKLDGWWEMEPWEAAHRVQINKDANDYRRFYDGRDAQDIVDRFLDRSGCGALPLDTPYQVTSGYGPRTAPCAGCSSWHQAWDFAKGCGETIYSIRPGTVTAMGWGSANGVDVTDAETNAVISYLHMVPGTESVSVGDTVDAGQAIGPMDMFGPSTGCHLDLRIDVSNATEDVRNKLTLSETIGGPPGYVHPNEYMGLFGVDLCNYNDGCSKAPGEN